MESYSQTLQELDAVEYSVHRNNSFHLKIENLDPEAFSCQISLMSGVDIALFANDACGSASTLGTLSLDVF